MASIVLSFNIGNQTDMFCVKGGYQYSCLHNCVMHIGVFA